jgi:hypothetical protein
MPNQFVEDMAAEHQAIALILISRLALSVAGAFVELPMLQLASSATTPCRVTLGTPLG